MNGLWLPPSADRRIPEISGAPGLCVCCRERGGDRKLTFVRGGFVDGHNLPSVLVRAILCRRCQTDGPDEGNSIPATRHGGGFCLQCGQAAGIIWKCATRNHVAERHPSLLEKLINDPYDEIAEVPQPEIIGSVGYETRDPEHPKVWF